MDKLNRPIGEIDITIKKANGTEYTQTIPNTVVPNAKELIARSLGNDIQYLINQISAYNSGSLLATATTISSYPSLGVVKFTVVFPQESFYGDIDELRLGNDAHGIFSQVLNLTLNKPEDSLLSIGWKIKPQ